MISFPTRKANSTFADIKLRHRNYDFFLFIEDEKIPHVYKKIITRIFNGQVKIGKVFSMNSKKNVLEKFSEWMRSASDLKKCVFIVDKDFDHFKGEILPSHNNLIELEYYTIENYLVSKEGVISLIQSKIFGKEDDEIDELLDWENWIGQIYQGFKSLFIFYAIANKYELEKNCSISPYRYLKKGSYQINDEQVGLYISKIVEMCKKTERIDFEREYKNIDEYYNSEKGYQFDSLIKGKYIYAAMLKYINHITGHQFDEDLCNLILVDSIKLEKLEFMKRKLIAI